MSDYQYVRYTKPMRSGGRNGTATCTGLEIQRFEHSSTVPLVFLQAFNSKERSTVGGFIEIPLDDVPEVILALQQMVAGPLGRLALDAIAAQSKSTTTVEGMEASDDHRELGDPGRDPG